jgi:hypothetical protein
MEGPSGIRHKPGKMMNHENRVDKKHSYRLVKNTTIINVGFPPIKKAVPPGFPDPPFLFIRSSADNMLKSLQLL